MSFSSFLKKIILRSIVPKHSKSNARPPRTVPAYITKKKAAASTAVADKETVTNKDAQLQPQPKSVKERQTALLLIMYRDLTGKELAAPEIVSGKLGEQVNFRLKAFENYDLVDIKGFTSYFAAPYALLTLTYLRKEAGSIWIISRDFDQQTLLGEPQLLRGKIGDTFQVYSPSFHGYHLMSVAGQIKGEFSLAAQQLLLYYRKDSWLSVIPQKVFLKILKTPVCFDAPNGNKLTLQLPINSVWRTFTKVKTHLDQTWYCLGGALWLRFNDLEVKFVTAESSFLGDTKTVSKKSYPTEPLKQPASISFVPQKTVSLFDNPNGRICTSVEHGKQVLAIAKSTVDGVIWYQLANYGWVQQPYLAFNKTKL
ncbi:MAG: MucBP domain-containing protein [Liquorilactobacillus satsumensis]|uniref:MucBP domain-containing protein n=1 Tax=Liquorilactobacillus satsumensis TaxID=259059 RepID=UPI0039EA0291